MPTWYIDGLIVGNWQEHLSIIVGELQRTSGETKRKPVGETMMGLVAIMAVVIKGTVRNENSQWETSDSRLMPR